MTESELRRDLDTLLVGSGRRQVVERVAAHIRDLEREGAELRTLLRRTVTYLPDNSSIEYDVRIALDW